MNIPKYINPPKILFDNSVRSFGMVAHGISIESNGPFANKLMLIQSKPAKSEDSAWLRDQIECLPTIARLAREERISAFSSQELWFEAMKRPGSASHFWFGDLFENVHVADVPDAVGRGYFWPIGPDEWSGEALSKFVHWLITSFRMAQLNAPFIRDRIDAFSKKNLARLDELKKICKGFSLGQLGDGMHLWTGHTNGLEYFLTLDRKITNVVRARRDFPVDFVPIWPSELLDLMGVDFRDPLPFEYGKRYYLNGQSYD